MSRHYRRAGALGAAVVAAVAFATPASAGPAQPADDPDFTLFAKEVTSDEGAEPQPTAPPAAGDTFSFASDLFRSKGGEKVGRDGVTCTVVRQTEQGGDIMCVGTFVLTGDPAGQITGQTLTAFSLTEEGPAEFEIAVTGGTGDFQDARGYINATEDGDHERLDFHLTG
ncbi:dirigent protein [Streptomyces sp. TRM64462]|uniref:dirigent protein n=1 Tax=Streptomyces sp. TRM64462 TaxID=2741726 RepID=UPI0015865B76|nr:dirigent protein [Streptomyces sp. TRM64462]